MTFKSSTVSESAINTDSATASDSSYNSAHSTASDPNYKPDSSAGSGTPYASSDSDEILTDDGDEPLTTSKFFDDYTTRLFVAMVGEDTLTTHYALRHPENYGIETDDVSLGEYYSSFSEEEHQKLLDYYYELLDYGEMIEELTGDQRITYRVLEDYIRIRLDYDKEDYFYFQEPLKPKSGTQTMLPVSMAEYSFSGPEDIETYLKLLQCIPVYFRQIEEFEKKKSEAGMFMSDETADEVIASCQSFINDPDNNMLITTFADRAGSIENLTEEQRKDYEDRNRNIILNEIIPAYSSMIDLISSLKGSGKNEYGLCLFSKGTDYYEYLIKVKSGTDMSPEELLEYLKTAIDKDYAALLSLAAADSKTRTLTGDISLYLGEPEDMLASLRKLIETDYPEAATEVYEINYVPEALESSMSPAFYLIPPVDDPDQNIIYLNRSQLDDTLRMFKTLAHEGYPGHLYQQTYYSSLDPAPVRKELSMLGYVEGWATYAELNAYDWVGLSENLARAHKLNDELLLCIYAYADVNIHCCAWTEADLKNYLASFNIYDEEAIHNLYRIIIGDPAGYLPYAVGNLQIRQMIEEAEKYQGDDFDLKDFHRFFLETGPCRFPILRDYFEEKYPCSLRKSSRRFPMISLPSM